MATLNQDRIKLPSLGETRRPAPLAGWGAGTRAGTCSAGPRPRQPSGCPFVPPLWGRVVSGRPRCRSVRRSVLHLESFSLSSGTPGRVWTGQGPGPGLRGHGTRPHRAGRCHQGPREGASVCRLKPAVRDSEGSGLGTVVPKEGRASPLTKRSALRGRPGAAGAPGGVGCGSLCPQPVVCTAVSVRVYVLVCGPHCREHAHSAPRVCAPHHSEHARPIMLPEVCTAVSVRVVRARLRSAPQ